ncbi:MAG TPA: DUF6457 domain-containing protein [Verrucomicrobiae bacterium]|nr:DUF6457 domain-containing protein [Verrucomicrobiae bacterium]
MNPWVDRFIGALGARPAPSCGDEEARLVLELAGAAAHTSGARPFAPLATYLAGQACAGLGADERIAALRRAVDSAREAGPAGSHPIPGAAPTPGS